MMKILFKIYVVLLVVTTFIGCSKEIDEGSSITEEKYNLLASKYNIKNVVSTRSMLDNYENIKPIQSIEQLEAVLEYINNKMHIISKEDEEEYDLSIRDAVFPLVKSTTEGPSDVVISGTSSDGKVAVYLNTVTPSVTNSKFYNTGLWDAFIGYEHNGGSATKSSDIINFKAHGDIILKIIWQGIELKRVPTVSEGYYNLSTKSGAITNL